MKLSLEIDPYNSTALHLIGRYSFEVAQLNFCVSIISQVLYLHFEIEGSYGIKQELLYYLIVFR